MIRFLARGAAEALARMQGELDGLRAEVRDLRATIDARAGTEDAALQARLAESAGRAAEAMERRIQFAAAEAMAFADKGLERHEATLRALGRRVAEISRAIPPDPPPMSAPAAAGEFLVGMPLPEARDARRIAVRDEREETFVADLANLPILPGGAARLFASHIVERIAPEIFARIVLPHWRSCLAPGGELVVVTLDAPAFAADLANLSGDLDGLRRRLGLDGTAPPLRALYDAEGLALALTAAGLAPEAPTHGASAELRIAARAGP